MRGIINGKIILENTILENHILLFDKKIIDILPITAVSNLGDIEIINANGEFVSPGFIDIHIHGANNYDAMDGTSEALNVISKTICKSGVTSFLPATMTMDKKSIYTALDNIRNSMISFLPGSEIIGAHLEGPFINDKYKGAQQSKHIIKPSFKFIENYIDIIKIITLAPEVDNAKDFIKHITDNYNTKISIGHSAASYEEAMEGINVGITGCTHTFNAMPPLLNRTPSILGAAFNSDIYCELIADTIHVSTHMLSIRLKIKGPEKIILITDSMRAAYSTNEISELGGQTVYLKDNSARLKDGTLAGSILTLNNAVKNFLNNTSASINDVIKMVTINPATYLGLQDRGNLKKGSFANITIFNKDIDILHTIVKGKSVFYKNEDSH